MSIGASDGGIGYCSGRAAAITACIFTAVAMLFVLLRVVTRWAIVRRFRVDDLFMGLAILSSIALTTMVVLGMTCASSAHLVSTLPTVRRIIQRAWRAHGDFAGEPAGRFLEGR